MFRWSVPLVLSAIACSSDGADDTSTLPVDDSATPDDSTPPDDSETPPDDSADDSGTVPIDTAHQAPDTVQDEASVIWYGNESERIGGTLANVGDVTGDGGTDLLIGAPLASDATSGPFFGRAYVVSPDVEKEEIELDSADALAGDIYLAHMSWDIAGQLDADDDGQDDLLLGAYWSALTGALDGSAQLYYGPVTDATLGPDVRFLCDEPHPASGLSIAALGDVSTDGTDDFAVGSPGSGVVYVVRGDDAWTGFVLLTDSATRVYGPGTYLGEDVLGGDWTGDGVGDLVATTSLVPKGPATVFVMEGPFGMADVLVDDAATSLQPTTLVMDILTFDAGDTDGDGSHDLAVALPTDGQGSVSLYATPLTNTPMATFVGSTELAQLGHSVAGLGDVNDDGFDDVAMGAPDPRYGDHRGTVVVENGPFTGTISVTPSIWIGEAGYDQLGWAVTGLGDVDGDGNVEMAVGAPEHGQDTGAVYLLSGWK
jgi:hypothetical protein